MWHVWVSSFGVTGAILIVGGYVLLQWQRNRYRFQLAKEALERGISESPSGPPYWVLSLRQGLMILVLGLGLLLAGGALYGLAVGIPPPESFQTQSTTVAPATEATGPSPVEAKGKAPKPKPPPNPTLERWHRAQDQQTIGLATVGCGLVLTLLGAVRTAFARVERRHSSDRQ